jgi:hypothetical protein
MFSFSVAQDLMILEMIIVLTEKVFNLQKCLIPQKKSLEKSSFNFEIIFEVFD